MSGVLSRANNDFIMSCVFLLVALNSILRDSSKNTKNLKCINLTRAAASYLA
jgi:hypothetical protein